MATLSPARPLPAPAPPPYLYKDPKELWEDAVTRCDGDVRLAAGLVRRWREVMGEQPELAPFYVQPLAMNAQDVTKIGMCDEEETYGLVCFVTEGGTTSAHDISEAVIQFLMDVSNWGFFIVDLIARQIRESPSSEGLREAILDYIRNCDDGPYSDVRAIGFEEVRKYMIRSFEA